MKNLLIVVILLIVVSPSFGQEKMSEMQSEQKALFSQLYGDEDYMSFVIAEEYVGEFEDDPIKFLKTHFDAKAVLSQVSEKEFDGLEVLFKTSAGTLKAKIDKEGEISRTAHKCDDALVPGEVRKILYRDHKGWTMVENNHIAKGRNGKVEKEYYRIKLIKGDDTKKVTIHIPDKS